MYWFLRMALFWIFAEIAQGTEVVLLDSNNVTFGNWTSAQHDGDVFPDPQQKTLYMWSTELETGVNNLFQFFFVCTFSRSNPQNNWLRSPFFAIQDAALVSLEIDYEVTPCADPASYPLCKEFIFVYYRFADSADDYDPINGTSYKQILQLPQNKTLPLERRNIKVSINVDVPSKKGMLVAFQDTGSCTYLYRIIVRFYCCPLEAQGLTVFPRTVVGNGSLHVIGKCQINASSEHAPWKLCLVNGEWGTVTGSCECNAGYELEGSVCQACRSGTYKDSVGNFTCQPCPVNSRVDCEGSANCSCLGNTSRAINTDDSSEAYTEITSTPGSTTRTVIEKSNSSTTAAGPTKETGSSTFKSVITILGIVMVIVFIVTLIIYVILKRRRVGGFGKSDETELYETELYVFIRAK